MAYPERFKAIKDELEWLYMELYGNRDMLHALEAIMDRSSSERKDAL